MDETRLTCTEPIPGGCPLPARETVLAHPSIDASGPMGQWAVHMRCGGEHTAERAAKSILTADPGATVLVFMSALKLEQGVYVSGFSSRITA